LELTLSLPLLLFTMALMVALGAAATWKVRTLVAGTNTAWRHRWPRGGWFEELRAPGWPSPGAYSFRGAGDLTQIDNPAFWHPVARGPLPQIDVNDRVLDPTRGLIEGQSSHQRLPPMLARLGPYQHDVRHLLLDDRFQYAQMGIPGNGARRMPRIYVLDGDPSSYADEDPHRWTIASGLFGTYRSAMLQARQRCYQSDLWIMDLTPGDPEFRAWGMPRDFHPRMRRFCSIDRDEVRMTVITPHQERIYGWNDPANRRSRRPDVPLSLVGGFIGLYRYQISVLFPPPMQPPPGHHLLVKIQTLQAFQQQLQMPPP
jgi:hypothetical protein